MATLYFTVEADYRRVLTLKDSIADLQRELKDADMGSKKWLELNKSLRAASQEYNSLCATAAKAGAKIEADFNKALKGNEKELESYTNTISALDTSIGELGKQIDRINKKRIEFVKKGDEKSLQQMREQIREMNELKAQRDELVATRNTTASDRMKLEADNRKMISAMNSQRSQSFEASINGKYVADVKAMANALADGGKSFSSYLEDAEHDSNKILSIFKDIVQTASGVAVGNLMSGGILTGYNKLEGMYHQAVRVRSEMEDVMSNMSAFLKSKDAANQFTSELSKAAYYMTADFSTLVAGSKQLISYGNKTEEIIPILSKLGDVSVGTGNSLMGLIELYNSAKARGQINAQQQMSWANQGIVLDQELAKLGMTKKGSKVTFEQLNAVLDAMTSEGGMFYNMQAEMMSNVSSMEGQLEDVLHNMYDEMGNFLQAPYNETLKFQISMAENWREIGTAIGGAVVAIGAYRTALVACRVAHEMVAGGEFTNKITEIAQRLQDSAAMMRAEKADALSGSNEHVDELKETIKEKLADKAKEALDGDTAEKVKNTAATAANTAAQTVNATSSEANAAAHNHAAAAEGRASVEATKDAAANVADATGAGVNAVSHVTLTGALKACAVAAKEMTVALLANPYTWIAVAVAGVAATIWYFVTALSAEEEAMQDLEDATNAHNDAMEEENRLIADSIEKYNDKTQTLYTQKKAYETLKDSAAKYKEELVSLLGINPDDFESDFSDWLQNATKEEQRDVLTRAREQRERNNAKSAADIERAFAGGFTKEYRRDYDSINANSHDWYDVVGINGNVRSYRNNKQDRQEVFDKYFKPFIESTSPEKADDEEFMNKYLGNLELMLNYLTKGSEQATIQARLARDTEEQEAALLRTRVDNLEIQKRRNELLTKEKNDMANISNNGFANQDAVDMVTEQFSRGISKDEARSKAQLYNEEAQKIYEQYNDLQDKIANETDAATKARMENQAKTLLNQFEQVGLLAGKWMAIKTKVDENTDALASTEQQVSFADLAEQLNFGDAPEDAAKKFWELFFSAISNQQQRAENQAKALSQDPKLIKDMQKDHQTAYKNLLDIQKKIQKGDLDFVKSLDTTNLSAKLQEKFDIVKRSIKQGDASISETLTQEILRLLGEDITTEKEAYSKDGGKDIDGDKALQRQKARIQQEKDIANERLQIERQYQDALFKEQQNEINLLEQGAERMRKQRDLDHRKNLDQIQRQYEDELKKARDAAQKRWETDQKNRSDEGKVGIFQDSYLANDDIYQSALRLADINKADKVFEENTKYLGIDAIVAKYDKGKTEYAKAMGEMAVEMDKLTKHRDALAEKLETADEKDKASITQKINYYNEIIDRVIEKQSVMLDESGKAREAFLKTYGSISQQIDVIQAEARRKLAETGGDAWSQLQSMVSTNESIIKLYEKNTTVPPAQRLNEVNAVYASAMRDLDNAISEYHEQTLNEELSAEERANARSLELAAQSARDKMEIDKVGTIGRINVDAIKNDPRYFAAMQDASILSQNSIRMLNDELSRNREALTNLPPDQLKVITDLMDKLFSEEVKKDPYAAMKASAKELADAQQVLAEKTIALNNIKETQRRLTEELTAAELDLRFAEESGELNEEELEAYRQRVQDLKTRSNNAYADANNEYQNAVNAVIAATNRLDKANNGVLGKVKEMSSTFRSIGSAISSMSGSKGGEIFGKAADVIAEITDAIVKVSEISKELNDDNKLNIETQNANTELQAAQINQQAAQTMYDAATTNASSNIDIPSGGTENVGGEQASSGGSSALGTASAIMQGIQMGISVGSKFYELLESTGVSGQAKYEKYAKKLHEVNELTDSVNRYRRASILAQQAEQNWFSSSGLSSLKDSWEVAAQSRDAYYKKLNEQQAAYRDQTKHDGDYLGNIIVGSIAGAVTGAAMTSEGGPYAMLAGAIVGGIVGGVAGATTSYAEQALGNSAYNQGAIRAQDNLRIETKKKSRSFMWIGGHNQKTADLRTWAREKYGEELFDSDGYVNKELAQEILDTYGDKLQGETEATLKSLIELKDQYDEYQENLKEYVSSLYSPLVDNFVDSMWQWFDSGRDALYSFREAAAGTFRDIMSDMMKTIVLERVVGSFQDDIKDLYDQFAQKRIDESTLMKSVTGMTNDLMGRYEEQMPVLQSMMTNMADAIEATGINMHQNVSASSGSSKAAANVTQDSIDETNGRMTAMQMTLQDINGNIVKYGELLAKGNEGGEAISIVEEGPEESNDYSAIISFYGDSIISLNAANMTQKLTMHGESLNAIGGIAQQIADSYIELQGIHDDTTAMNKAMSQMRGLMNDWDNYIRRI